MKDRRPTPQRHKNSGRAPQQGKRQRCMVNLELHEGVKVSSNAQAAPCHVHACVMRGSVWQEDWRYCQCE